MFDASSLGIRALKQLLEDHNIKIPAGSEKLELVSLVPSELDFRRVRNDIARSLQDRSHDDGSYGPLMLRFAWHSSGTYDKTTDTGGSNGGTIWREIESNDPENAGFEKAKKWLLSVQARHTWVSKADLAILSAYVFIEDSGGPHIPFMHGRIDFTEEQAVAKNGSTGCPFGDGKHNPCGSRLPPADLGSDPNCPDSAPPHVREAPTIKAIRGTFERMGFNDKEMVNLIILGHQYGRCHPEASGYEHPWYAFDPAHWNVYGPGGLGYISLYSNLASLRETRSSKRKRQYNFNMGTPEPFMMLVSDMCLGWDPEFKKHVHFYDTHRLDFRYDARDNFKKLTELGCGSLLKPERSCTPQVDRYQ